MARQKTFKDLTGMKFGEWEALSYEGKSMWKCRCSCGNIKNVHRYTLITGKSNSCGKCDTVKVSIGDKFGNWEVIDDTVKDYKVQCRCSCGTIRSINIYTLKSGASTGCGHTKNADRVIDLTGRQFGELTVLKYNGNSTWECKCSCGRTTIKYRNHLLDGRATSCGLHVANKQYDNIQGMRFGKLVAKKYLGNKRWLCDCDCGNKKIVLSHNLKNNSTRSCGCILYKPTYEDIINLINEFNSRFKEKPSVTDLARLANVSYKSMEYHIVRLGINNTGLLGSSLRSQGERELARYISSIFDGEVVCNSRNTIEGQELDIFIPSKMLGIEYNGTYWHNSFRKEKDYHQNKSLQCLKKNIRLIHIFEYEWLNTELQPKIKELIKNALNIRDGNTAYARDLSVQEISSNEAFDFFNANHLQGGIHSKINIGLFSGPELIGAISFGKPRYTSDFEWEIYRLGYKIGWQVVGGTEKMFSYFLEKYKPSLIISYCNIGKFTGKIYEKLGFTLSHISSPNYVWVTEHSNDVITRYQSTKSNLIKNIDGVDPDDTEDTIMYKLGYYKLYDSGNKVYTWKKSQSN